jgi:two-component system LytT family response regulator
MIKCLIVEDEFAAQQNLLHKLNFMFPECEVIAIIEKKTEALDFINSNEIDIVFMDIQIRGGLGINIIEEATNKNYETIFVTAYSEYAIQALNANASYYLLKPLSDKEFQVGVSAVISRLTKQREKKTILLYNKGGYVSLEINEIIYIESEGAYSKIVTQNETFISTKNLGHFEKMLPIQTFRRSHHSYIVGLLHIKLIKKGRSGIIEMINGTEIPIAQRRMIDFLDLIIR